MKEVILVPEDRIRVVKSKPTVDMLKDSLRVDMETEGNHAIINGEGIELYTAKTIIKAIARGFSPPRAEKLLEEGQELELSLIHI